MDRQAFLDWAAQLLDGNHTGGKPYVSVNTRGLSLGIDAEDDGSIRVHLFTNVALLTTWLQSLTVGVGPLPGVAQPIFRQGPSGGDRYYFGFGWQHSGNDYTSEQLSVQAFTSWLRSIAQQQGITF